MDSDDDNDDGDCEEEEEGSLLLWFILSCKPSLLESSLDPRSHTSRALWLTGHEEAEGGVFDVLFSLLMAI